MAATLSVDRLVRVSVDLSPKAVPRRGFGLLICVSSEDFISPLERIRIYTGLDGVAGDAGLSSSVYSMGQLFFSQSPKPARMAVGRWVKDDSPAELTGGIVAEDDQSPSAWAAITDGSFGMIINGVGVNVTDLNFAGQTNMNGVAGVISAALAPDGANCRWEGDHFVFKTTAKGESAALGYGGEAGEGTDISVKMAITEKLALPVVPGMKAETALECVARLADLSADWYGLAFADLLEDDEHISIAGFIEGTAKSRMYLVTETGSRVLSSTVTNDIPSRLKALGYKRSFTQYSKNPYAVVSAAGRAFSVNFSSNRSTITLMYKQEPGVVAEGLTETQAQVLESKNCNVFVNYDNDTAILQNGVMGNGAYFDEIHGLDWLQNAIQTECYNLLYTSKTKLPQTDVGVTQLVTTVSRVMDEGVNNGLIAPGMWNADGFGNLERGDYLQAGYYIYAQSVDDQAQSEREQRKAPPIQGAAKLAGAIHSTDIAINVNR